MTERSERIERLSREIKKREAEWFAEPGSEADALELKSLRQQREEEVRKRKPITWAVVIAVLLLAWWLGLCDGRGGGGRYDPYDGMEGPLPRPEDYY